MSEAGPAASLNGDALTKLVEEVAALGDLFRRRLLEDKAKARLYDELYSQLEVARGALASQLLWPLFRELLLVVDRIDALRPEREGALSSVRDELLEILERRSVTRMPATRSFDPTIHEAVSTSTDGTEPIGTVVEVMRPGYTVGQALLRPARVVVAARLAAPDSSLEDAPTDVVDDL